MAVGWYVPLTCTCMTVQLCTYRIELSLCLLLYGSDVVHRHVVPLVQPAKHLAMEVAKEPRVHLSGMENGRMEMYIQCMRV